MTRTTEYKSPLGRMLLAVDEEGLTGAWFEGQKYLPEGVAPENEETALPPVLESACRWLDLYFSGQEPDFMPRLHLEGTAFRRAVWELLRKIPYGKTTTYGALAKQLEAETGRCRRRQWAAQWGITPCPSLCPATVSWVSREV